MSYVKCPFCESPDVHLNEKNELFCFTCFNLFSSDNITDGINTPPKFPAHLERRKLRKKSIHSNFNTSLSYKNFLRKII